MSFWERNVTLFRRQTLVGISRAWESLSGTARAVRGTLDPDLPRADTARIVAQMQACLDARGGEVSARQHAVALGRSYLDLSDRGKLRFLQLLANHFATNRSLVRSRMEALERCSEEGPAQAAAENALRDALEAPRLSILKQFSSLPQGVKFLVDMRGDLLRLKEKHPELSGLEMDLRRLFASWFDIGLLDLRQITWQSPASLLEKLIAYEAVHEIRSWSDLKNRLDSDRRCYAFFHHKMPEEPLIFVEIALTNSVADNIHHLLDEGAPATDPHAADTAIFYSISNAQRGLSGISFGNFLIKRVVEALAADLKNLRHFATLSPIPGFRRWLENTAPTQEITQALKALQQPEWHRDAKRAEAAKKLLMPLCARYLVEEKRKNQALDPVAHFHLTNGAQMERLNWLADTSAKGLSQSAGMMVNYHYDRDQIDTNHERYTSGKPFQPGRSIRALLK